MLLPTQQPTLFLQPFLIVSLSTASRIPSLITSSITNANRVYLRTVGCCQAASTDACKLSRPTFPT